jgi:hypothetical protein
MLHPAHPCVDFHHLKAVSYPRLCVRLEHVSSLMLPAGLPNYVLLTTALHVFTSSGSSPNDSTASSKSSSESLSMSPPPLIGAVSQGTKHGWNVLMSRYSHLAQAKDIPHLRAKLAYLSPLCVHSCSLSNPCSLPLGLGLVRHDVDEVLQALQNDGGLHCRLLQARC